MTRVTTTTETPAIPTAIPDLRDIPADRLAELGGSALAHSIALCRERAEAGNPPAPFNSSI